MSCLSSFQHWNFTLDGTEADITDYCTAEPIKDVLHVIEKKTNKKKLIPLISNKKDSYMPQLSYNVFRVVFIFSLHIYLSLLIVVFLLINFYTPYSFQCYHVAFERRFSQGLSVLRIHGDPWTVWVSGLILGSQRTRNNVRYPYITCCLCTLFFH